MSNCKEYCKHYIGLNDGKGLCVYGGQKHVCAGWMKPNCALKAMADKKNEE